MPEYVVVDHHLDEVAGLYRLTVGVRREYAVPMFDEAGNVLLSDPEPVLDEDGNPVLAPPEPLVGEDGEPVTDEEENQLFADPQPLMRSGEPLIEMVTDTVPLGDYVFAADDERWKRFKGPETIAAKQREIALEALTERERVAEKQAAAQSKIVSLSEPGSTL